MTHSVVDQIWQIALAALLPARCALCGDPGAQQLPLCARCRAALPVNGPACTRCALPMPHGGVCGVCLKQPPPQHSAYAAFRYAPPFNQLIPRLKFHGRLPVARLCGALLADALEHSGLPLPEVLVPVPLHDARLRERGYDQALEIAREAGRRLRLPVWDEVRRARATAPQSGLAAAVRRRNLRGAFTVLAPPPGGRLAIVDDVMTTGATVRELARTVLGAGAQQVDVCVLARVP